MIDMAVDRDPRPTKVSAKRSRNQFDEDTAILNEAEGPGHEGWH